MNSLQKVRLGAAVLTQLATGLLILAFAYMLGNYYLDAENPLRHEALFAAWSMLLYALGSSLLSALLAISLKPQLSRRQFRWLAWPAVGLGTGFGGLYVFSVAYSLAN